MLSPDGPEIQYAMEMSSLAYKDRYSLPSTCIGFSGKYDGQAILSTGPGAAVAIAFRGSESCRDWSINLLRYRRSISYIAKGRVHAGFLLQYQALRDRLRAALPEGARDILVTGHSLGGALAMLCASEFAYLCPEYRVRCIIFGAPRVGNPAFVSGVENQRNLSILRIQNRYDLVPCIPFFGYRHTTTVLNMRTPGLRWWHWRQRHGMAYMYQRFRLCHGSDPGAQATY
jgi:pimeloyl-ACP methyl ester carboxylesterase